MEEHHLHQEGHLVTKRKEDKHMGVTNALQGHHMINRRKTAIRKRNNTVMWVSPGEALTLKGGAGMSGSQDPLFMHLLPFFRPPATIIHFFKPQLLAEINLSQKFLKNSALQLKFGSKDF